MESLETRQLLSAAGTLDATFGNGSGTMQGFGGPNVGYAQSVAAQPDGKVVVAGITTLNSSMHELTVARLNTDGSLDATFGTGGRVILAQSPSVGDSVNVASVLIQPDGKIVVAGQDVFSGSTTYLRDAVFRLNATGSLDTSFGTSGEASFPNGAIPEFPRIAAAALESDGKIVLAGVAGSGTTTQSVAAARLNADGSFDSSFGSGGTATTSLVVNGINILHVTSVAIQGDNKVVVGGYAVSAQSTDRFSGFQDFEAAVIRFNANGSLDTSFGGTSAGGKLLIPEDPANPSPMDNSAIQGVAIQADGKIVVGGGINNAPDILTRLNVDGSFDTTFGTAGQTRVPVQFNGVDNGLIAQKDGKLLLSGVYTPTTSASTTFVRLARFNADGTLDSTFGNTGIAGITTFTAGTNGITPSDAAIAADGKILVAGSIYLASTGVANQQYIVARVVGTTILPANKQAHADFDGDGKTDIAAYLASLGQFAYRPSSGGADVLVPFGVAGAGQTVPAIGDYTGAGHAEIGVYIPNQALYAYRPANGGADVVQPFGMAGLGQSIPAVGDYTGSGKDDLAIYLPALGSFAIRPAGGGADQIIPFGALGAGQSVPAPGDYDGDGKTDLAVYIPSQGVFAYRPSAGGADVIIPFGIAGGGQTLPAPGDYDDDGKTDIAAYLPTLGLFAYRPSSGGADVLVPFGTPNDGTIPIPGDYSGSGHDEIAIYDPNSALFAYRPASGADVLTIFGQANLSNSVPVAALPTASTPGTITAFSTGPKAPSPAGLAVPSGSLAATHRVGRASVVAQSGTDLSGRRVS